MLAALLLTTSFPQRPGACIARLGGVEHPQIVAPYCSQYIGGDGLGLDCLELVRIGASDVAACVDVLTGAARTRDPPPRS
ncbi:MAG: hypothetical protein H6737_23605 [Alphaproteobacteria bacterium]|nr:hypothetical protein [Alphaproteobacteria bacterium]